MLVSPSEVVAKVKATIKECSVRDVHSCLTAGTLLIDIREPARAHANYAIGRTYRAQQKGVTGWTEVSCVT